MKTKPYKATSLPSAQREVRFLRKQRREMLDNWTRDFRCARLLQAIILGVARWEFFSGCTREGEVCVGGMRYVTKLGRNGCPIVTDHIDNALGQAIARKGGA